DTTSVEAYTRSASRVDVDQCGRSPRVLRRHFVYDYSNGVLTHFSMVVTPPGSATPTQTVEATFAADSMRTETHNGTQPVQESSLAWPAGTFLVAGSSPWSSYETQIMKWVQTKSDHFVGRVYYLGSPSAVAVRIAKQADGTLKLDND